VDVALLPCPDFSNAAKFRKLGKDGIERPFVARRIGSVLLDVTAGNGCSALFPALLDEPVL